MITVYAKDSCQGCVATKRFLAKRCVEFAVVNVDEDDAVREMLVGRGFSQMPVVDPGNGVDGWFSGFNPAKLSQVVSREVLAA